MDNFQRKIDQIISFKTIDKFSDEAWNKRGLNPSSRGMSDKLNELLNQTAEELIKALQNEAQIPEIKSLFKRNLRKFDRRFYDTEEREFICDLFYDLASIVRVDFKRELSIWLYGRTLTILQEIFSRFKPKNETINQECLNCKELLTSYIQRKAGIPEKDWMIVQCDNCKEYNILDLGPGIKMVTFGNYKLIDSFPQKDYNYEQVKIRAEQFRVFRSN